MNIVRYGVVAVAVLAWSGVAAAEPDHEDRLSSSFEDRHREAMQVELEYRQHLERLNRLREFAQQHHDADRLAELEQLHDRLRSRHAMRLREIRQQMDDGSARRLDETLAAARNQDEWVREHRDKSQQLWDERHDRHEARHADHAERSDRREAHREQRREQRADRRSDRRETRRERRADDRRQQHRHQSRHDRREIRGEARDRAEQRWRDTRAETAVKIHTSTHMRHAASRLAEKRWQEESRDEDAKRWERAARRSGMLDDVQASASFRAAAKRERVNVDEFSSDDADREFERLRREIGK